jgi:hypothetical protein
VRRVELGALERGQDDQVAAVVEARRHVVDGGDADRAGRAVERVLDLALGPVDLRPGLQRPQHLLVPGQLDVGMGVLDPHVDEPLAGVVLVGADDHVEVDVDVRIGADGVRLEVEVDLGPLGVPPGQLDGVRRGPVGVGAGHGVAHLANDPALELVVADHERGVVAVEDRAERDPGSRSTTGSRAAGRGRSGPAAGRCP